MKIMLIILGTIAAVGALTAYAPFNLTEAKDVKPFANVTYTAKRAELRLTVSENGYLKAKNSVHLSPEYNGENKITFLIDEGAEVAEGDSLVTFDKTRLESQLEESRGKLIQYETELEASNADLKIQKRDNEATIEKTDLNLEIAQLTLKRFEVGEYENTLRRNRLAVEKAESELKRATESFEPVPALFDEGFLTKIQMEEERIRLREAEINVENAVKDLELYEQLTAPMELKQKEAAVREAERAQVTGKERASINIKQKEARVSQHERHLKAVKNRIEELEKNLGYMEIKAPHAGIALYGDPARPWYTNEIKLGNTVWNGMTIITLPDLQHMQVLINIHEADINLLELEQRCTITIDTYRGQVFGGEVTDIAKVASNGRFGDSTNKQFRVEVTMDDTEIKLRAGVTAKVEVLIEILEDVVQVPVHAVFREGEEFVTFYPDGTGFGRRVVKIGKSNAFNVEITEGLEAGEEVLLIDPREETAETADRSSGNTPEEDAPGFSASGSTSLDGE